jgi:hypothetical protein
MDAIVDLTGGVALGIKEVSTDFNSDDNWNELNSQLHRGCYMLGVAINEKLENIAKPAGLLTGHQYTILGCIQTQTGNHRLLKIRNPWGCREWKGRFSDGSKEWTPDLIQEVGAKFGDDGTFYMCFEDFCRYWSYIDGVRLFNLDNEWNTKTLAGAWGLGEGGYHNSKNPQYILHVESQSEVCLSLLQYDSRYVGDEKETDAHIALYLLDYKGRPYDSSNPQLCDRTFDFSPALIVTKSKFRVARETIVEAKLDAGTYVLVASTYNNQDETPFIIRAFVKQSEFQLTSLPTQESVYQTLTIQGEWNEETAGGCSNSWKWIKNKQYLISVTNSHAMDISISLQQIPGGNNLFAIGGLLLEPNAEDPFTPVNQIKHVSQLRPYCATEHVDNIIKNIQSKQFVYVPTTFAPQEKKIFTVTALWRKDINPSCNIQITPLDTQFKSIQSEWTSDKSGGCSNYPSTWLNNPQFELKVNTTSTVNVSVVQNVTGSSLTIIGFYIFEDATSTKPLAHSNFSPSEACHFSYNFHADRKYIIMPCTFEMNQMRQFQLIASSKANVQLSLSQIH